MLFWTKDQYNFHIHGRRSEAHMRVVSQKTAVEIMRAFEDVGRSSDYTKLLYGRDFPDWFVAQASNCYDWNWQNILIALRTGNSFDSSSYFPDGGITGEYWSRAEKRALGDKLIQRLAALAVTLPRGESVYHSLQLDGFDVDKSDLRLIGLEGPISAAQEEDALTILTKQSGLPNIKAVEKHIEDAHGLYTNGKFHPSLNESRNLLQAIIDAVSSETDRHGKHSLGLPGATANRLEYLKKLAFLTADEEAAYKAAWGSLSAGSHPGVPEREQARIGLILALEFAQLLLLKFENWRSNGHRGFSNP